MSRLNDHLGENILTGYILYAILGYPAGLLMGYSDEIMTKWIVGYPLAIVLIMFFICAPIYLLMLLCGWQEH